MTVAFRIFGRAQHRPYDLTSRLLCGLLPSCFFPFTAFVRPSSLLRLTSYRFCAAFSPLASHVSPLTASESRMNFRHGIGFVPLALLFDPFVGFEGGGDGFDGVFEDIDVAEVDDAHAELSCVV